MSHVLVLVAGVLLGAASASHVWLVASKALREASHAEFISEQEFLANRAHRENDRFREVLHRMNVADAQSEVGFRWLHRSRNATYWEWFRFPWESYWVLQTTEMYPNTEKHTRGREILESQYRAAAALALERFGSPGQAKVQWNRATELQPSWSPQDHREYQERLQSHIYDPELEAAYLESNSWAELEAALAKARQKAGWE